MEHDVNVKYHCTEITTSFVDLEHVKPGRKKLSLPVKLNMHRNGSKMVKTKLAKRNIISAKLSFFVMLFLFLGGLVISITYNKFQITQVSVLGILLKKLFLFIAFYLFPNLSQIC